MSTLDELEQSLTYSDDVLLYLRSKLEENDLDCLRLVAQSKGPYGLLRTKIPDFKENRRRYDIGFTKLEAQGLIVVNAMGNLKPYFLTVRGEQLLELENRSSNATEKT